MTTPADHTSRAHSRLGASAAHRWMACPGSVALSATVADVQTVFAAEGTAAHELAEWCLRNDTQAEEWIDRTIKVGSHEFVVDAEMADGVQLYIDTIRGAVRPGDVFAIEQRFHLHQVDEQFFGTADAIVYRPDTRELFVFDLKYGRGHAVEVRQNPQFLYYGLGAALAEPDRGVGDVELVVVQPRCPHPDGPVRRWRTNAVEMLEFSADLVDAAEATRKADAPRIPGEQCKFCAAAAICPELRGHVQKVAASEFGAAPAKPDRLSSAELAAILDERDVIKAWLKAVEAYAHSEATHGRPPAGYKLVATRAKRDWIDEQIAKMDLMLYGLDETDIVTSKLKSPAQVEKLLGKSKDDIADLWHAESKGSVLVSDADPRPPIKGNATADFGAVE